MDHRLTSLGCSHTLKKEAYRKDKRLSDLLIAHSLRRSRRTSPNSCEVGWCSILTICIARSMLRGPASLSIILGEDQAHLTFSPVTPTSSSASTPTAKSITSETTLAYNCHRAAVNSTASTSSRSATTRPCIHFGIFVSSRVDLIQLFLDGIGLSVEFLSGIEAAQR